MARIPVKPSKPKPPVKSPVRPKTTSPVKVVQKQPKSQPKEEKVSGLSMLQIMRFTPDDTRYRARTEITIKKYNPQAKTRAGFPGVTAICVSDKGKPQRPHKCTIAGKEMGKPISKQKAVVVDCDCPAYVYWGSEWALAQHGAARIKRGNGEAPDARNPAYIPHVCKHLYALMLLVRREGD